MYYIPFTIYCPQKQLQCKMKSRFVSIECTGYVFWLLFLRRLYSIFIIFGLPYRLASLLIIIYYVIIFYNNNPHQD